MNSKIIACIVEGNAEQAIMDLLIDNNVLIFSRDDLIDRKILSGRYRNIDTFLAEYVDGRDFNGNIIDVYYLLDSKNQNTSHLDKRINIKPIHTSPEIEILYIIYQGKHDDYVKKYQGGPNKMKASTYCKTILKIKNVKTYDFIIDTFKNNINELIKAIKKHRFLHKDKYTIYNLFSEHFKEN
ncbi:MAG: hypothetical protein LBM99_03690 [Bacillales bacterium]|nr:hypothetical protein [Bacillales bacterium]